MRTKDGETFEIEDAEVPRETDRAIVGGAPDRRVERELDEARWERKAALAVLRYLAEDDRHALAQCWEMAQAEVDIIVARQIRLRRERDAAVGVLREAEWAGHDGRTGCCPLCCRWDHEGHSDDCRLAAVLREECK